MVTTRAQLSLLLAVVAAASAGCGTFRDSVPKIDDVAAANRRRHADTVRRLDEGRDYAEFLAAKASWSEGDNREAIARLRQIIQRNPDHVDARLLLAELLLSDSHPDEAIEVLAPAAEAHPENRLVQHTMDALVDAVGEHAAASPDPASPERDERGLRKCGLETGDEAGPASSGRWPSPRDSQTSTPPAPMPPGTPPLAPRTQGKPQSAVTLASLETGRYPDPHVPPPSGKLAFLTNDETAADGSGCAADAAGAGRTAGTGHATAGPDQNMTQPAQNLIQDGARALAGGNVEAARADFQKAVTLGPHNPQIAISAAVAALRYNRPRLAIDLLEPLRGRFADSAAFWRVLGTAQYRQGDFVASQASLEQALSLDKSSALAYFLLGRTLSKLAQPERAESCLRQAARIDPRYAGRR